MKKAGRRIDPADYPPGLEWEAPVWTLYAKLSSQWRSGFGGRTGLDYGPFIGVIQAKGWMVERTLELLRAIENEVLEWEEEQRKDNG